MFNKYAEIQISNGGENCQFHLNSGRINTTPGGPDLNELESPSPNANSQQDLNHQAIDHLIHHSGTFWNDQHPKSINVDVLNKLKPILNDYKTKNKCNSPAFQNICNAINLLLNTSPISGLNPIQPTSTKQQNISLNVSTVDDATPANNDSSSNPSLSTTMSASTGSRTFAQSMNPSSSSAFLDELSSTPTDIDVKLYIHLVSLKPFIFKLRLSLQILRIHPIYRRNVK